jgi:recombinational DNA repair protein RecR
MKTMCFNCKFCEKAREKKMPCRICKDGSRFEPPTIIQDAIKEVKERDG